MTQYVPKISIVMPVMNRGNMIEHAIRSVLDQAYPNLELIIIDGGSTDATIDVIKKYEKHIAYWHSKPDGSPAAAFNAGIRQATGDLIGFLMSDDWYEPGILAEIATYHYAKPETDILICGGRLVSYNEETGHYANRRVFISEKKQRLTVYDACFNDHIAICCYFIKPSVFERAGLFQPYTENGAILVTNDKDWVIRVALQHISSGFVPFLGYTFRAHEGSMSFSENKDVPIRYCREHQEIALRLLSRQSLSIMERFILLAWYNQQSVRLILLSLLYQKDRLNTLKSAVAAFKKHPINWPFMFVMTVTDHLTRKIGRRAKALFARASS